MKLSRPTILSLCGVYAVVVVAYAIIVPKWFQWIPPGVGAFGEMFGAFSAFFTGLAFLGIVYTIWLQREELEQTKRQVAQTAAAQERAERALSVQIKASVVAARLSAISLLIAEEIKHLGAYHDDQLRRNSPEALTEGQIAQYVAEFEKKESEGQLAQGDSCFLRNMKFLRELKTDLRLLYAEIRGLSV